MARNDLEHTYEILRVMCKDNLPLPIRHVEEIIIYCIVSKDDFSAFLDVLHIISCILYSILEHLDFPILIYRFPMDGDIVKCTHLRSNLIPKVEEIE